MNKYLRRLAVLPAAGALTLTVTGPASAHVTVTPSTTAAGAYTVLTVSVPHGCDGSPTTKVAVQIPESIVSVTPTRNPFYDVDKVMEKLDQPIEGEGGQITERVAQVVYTAKTPLPDGQRDAFELSLQIPEDAAGQTLTFPSIQTCEQGETAWTEVPAAGQSEEELEHPAPAFEVTEATGAGDHGVDPGSDAAGAVEDHADDESPSTSAVVSTTDDDSSNTLGILGLVAGLLGLALGGIAVARTRGRA
jgi:uncharacterized protein YcnI